MRKTKSAHVKNPPRPISVLPILLTAALSAAAPALAAGGHAAARHTPRPSPAGSFTPLRVESFAELKSQVSHSRAIRQRYARFFHMPESAVPKFVSSELYPVRLARARTCVVYYVTRTGQFRPHTVRLPSGSRVFALRSGGQPALNFVCGNGFLIPTKNTVVPVTDHPPAAYAFGVDSPTDGLPELASVGPGYAATPIFTLVSPSLPVPGGAGVSRYLPIAGLGLLSLHGGHHASAVAVPEPDAALLLLAGLPLLGLAARRRRQG